MLLKQLVITHKFKIKLAESKHYTSMTTQGWAWLSALKGFFIAVDIVFVSTMAKETQIACQYIVALIGGNQQGG